MRALRIKILGVGLLGIAAYLVVWGATWMAGDKSAAISGVRSDGSAFGFYPGVLFGGLPPNPMGSYWNFPFFGIVLGLVMLIVGVITRRRTRAALPTFAV